jgi:uncharacterized membrane protein
MNSSGTGCGENRLETLTSIILIIGVALSLCLEATGIVYYYLQHGNLNIATSDMSLFVHGSNFFSFLYSIFTSESASTGAVFFITLGMAVLILTPYTVVVAAFLYFLKKMNLRYLAVTGVVLTIITVSLVLH